MYEYTHGKVPSAGVLGDNLEFRHMYVYVCKWRVSVRV